MSRVYSVGEVNSMVKRLLERSGELSNLQIEGEISNFRRYGSGHCYFSLKDASGVLRSVMFAAAVRTLRFAPHDGAKVIAVGHIGVYERDGAYQFYVDLMVPAGVGTLQRKFEELKVRLTAEGLFSAERKRPLPAHPRVIGVVTSSTGAVIHDIITVSYRRDKSVKLILYPVKVQGEGAAEQIAHGINFFNRENIVDLIIVGRGGGTLEDLWAFNEEIVVREVAASRLPVISAVGHEVDVTLTDFAADRRAATPSQAVEIAVPDRSEAEGKLVSLQRRLELSMLTCLTRSKERLKYCQKMLSLHGPQRLVEEREQALDSYRERLANAMRLRLERVRQRHSTALLRLKALSPLGVLARGYSITMNEVTGEVITSEKQIHKGTRLLTQVAHGMIASTVERTGKDDGLA